MVRFQCGLAGLAWFAAGCLSAADRNGAADSNIPILTVCQALSDRGRYADRTVIIVGRWLGTNEGSWLDEGCGLKLLIEGRTYPTTISTSYVVSSVVAAPQKPKGFKWDKRLLQQALDKVKKTTRLEYDAQWCAVYGRLETAIPIKVTLDDGRFLIRDGYGHLNSAPAQLVWPAKDGYLKLKGK